MANNMATAHSVSDFLQDRWPVLPEERERGSLVVSVAHGTEREFAKLAELITAGLPAEKLRLA